MKIIFINYLFMRSLTAIILFPFMLLNAAGYLFVLEIQKYDIRRQIKQQIKAGVPDAELVLFKMVKEKPNPAWQCLGADEFRYNGKMYDLVRQENHGDTTWYYCLADEKETQLFANLEELVKRDVSQNGERRQRIERLLSLFSLLFFRPHDDEVSSVDASAMAWSHHDFGLKIWIDVPPTPPPEA